VAMRGSPRNYPEALRLDDVLDTNGLVLFSLDDLTYPHATRKVAAWVLLGMGRLARHLPEVGEFLVRPPAISPTSGSQRALLLVDEVGALGTAARHLRGLVGRAREAGLAVVLATQGLTDLEAVDRALVHRAAVAAHRWRVTVAGCQVGRHSERGCSPAGRLRPNGVPARARGEHAP